MPLDANAFRTAAEAPRKVTRVDTPIGEAFVRTMNALERDDAEEAAVRSRGTGHRLSYAACLVAACLCDEKGDLVFADQEQGRDLLTRTDEAIVWPLFGEAQRLAGRLKADREATEKKPETGNGSGT